MKYVLPFVATLRAGCVSQHQQAIQEYVRAENHGAKHKHGKERTLHTVNQRHRLVIHFR